MRVLIAPGPFGPGLAAVQAAAAIASGWARRAPADDLVVAPVSDGGEGCVDVLHHWLGGRLLATTVQNAGGEPTPTCILVVGDCAYVEAAHVAGAELAGGTDPERASSFGVGQLVAEAVRAGVSRVVVGVGTSGVACNDGGAGLLAALGAVSRPANALLAGSTALGSLEAVDMAAVRDLVGTTSLALATDDDVALLGLLGTTNAAGRARGLRAEAIPLVDGRLERFADLVARRPALAPGAGAGGGVGYALLVAGATRLPGLRTVMETISLARSAARSDLVLTGEDAFDLSVGSGEVVTAVAAVAGSVVRPCIALTNRLAVGARQTRALGIESVYSVAELVAADLPGLPADRLAAAAERVARTWSWSR